MTLVDMNQPELERYTPEREEPDDFDEFWAVTLREAFSHTLRTPARI